MKQFILRKNHDWAIIVIDESHGLLVMIHSSYGSWAYNWSQPGTYAVNFLETAECGYTFSKFSNAMRLGASQKIVDREYGSYMFFYDTFWKMLIEKLKI